MPTLFSLYADDELAALIAQVKAAVPAVLAGQRVKVGDSEFDRATLADLEAFGAGLGRERAARERGNSRLIAVRKRRPDAWRRG